MNVVFEEYCNTGVTHHKCKHKSGFWTRPMKGLIHITISIRMVFGMNNRFNMQRQKKNCINLLNKYSSVPLCMHTYDCLWVCEHTWLVRYLLNKVL